MISKNCYSNDYTIHFEQVDCLNYKLPDNFLTIKFGSRTFEATNEPTIRTSLCGFLRIKT